MDYREVLSKWVEDPTYSKRIALWDLAEDRVLLRGKIILRRAGECILINKDSRDSIISKLQDGIGVEYRGKLLYVGEDCIELDPEKALLDTKWSNSYRDRIFISYNHEVMPHVMKDIYIYSKVYYAKRRRLLGEIRADHYIYPEGMKSNMLRDIQIAIFIPRAKLLITTNRDHTVEEGYTILYCGRKPSYTTKNLLAMVAECYVGLDDRKMRDKIVRGMKLDSEDMLTFLELVSEISSK